MRVWIAYFTSCFLVFGPACGNSHDQRTKELRDSISRERVYTSIAEASKAPGKVYKLDLSGQDLDSIPRQINKFKNLVYLDLSENNIRAIPAEFYELHELKTLNLQGNFIEQDAIDSLVSGMTDVGITYSRFPPECNNYNECLKYSRFPALKVSLESDADAKKELEQLATLDNIVYLDLSLVQDNTVPPVIGNFTNLETLSLFNNGISSLPGEMSRLKRIRTLDLSKNLFTRVPSCIYDMPELNELNFYDNQLQTFSCPPGALQHLVNLCLDGNHLTTLSPTIRSLRALERLSLNMNELKTLPGEIGELKQLRELNAGSNKLIEVPESVGDLAQLEILDLSGNELRTIPGSFVNLKKLTRLNLENNLLSGQEKDRIKAMLPGVEIVF